MPCLWNTCVQPVGVLGEVFEPHGAILDEGDRLPVALHRHHDVEARARRTSHTALWKAGIGRLDDGVGKAEIAHQLDELLQAPQIVFAVVAGEFDEQDRLGRALDEAVDGRPEHGDLARQLDHRAVDELDRGGIQRRRCAASPSIAA